MGCISLSLSLALPTSFNNDNNNNYIKNPSYNNTPSDNKNARYNNILFTIIRAAIAILVIRRTVINSKQTIHFTVQC